MAHPDDIEMTCAGTLVLLRRAGWDVHLATMTAGDLGTATRSRAAISRIRKKEAAASAKLLGAARWPRPRAWPCPGRPQDHTSELQSHTELGGRLLLCDKQG